MVILVMGVAGCGKSTLGQALAEVLGWRFLEGDDFHPAANRQKMAAGIALDDADRWPWLDAICAELRVLEDRGEHAVLSCSALKQSYRARLRVAVPAMRIVHLHGDSALIGARLGARRAHFMPASLLSSQLATLEAPAPDERALRLDVACKTAQQVARVRRWLDESS
ncbi:MAG: gluconokinase [Gammaproteobacteria bacterium]|nr:gluconokinase [Gammaproteobacteria bacterium]